MKKRLVILMLLVLFMARAYGMGCLYDSVPKLPLIVMPAETNANTPLVLFITGDGGWKNFDPRLAGQFVNRQAPVVALNALHYFWSRKTPEQATATIQMLLEKYMKSWHKQAFILVGFSFGADVMPFIVNRLPGNLMQACKGVVLFSPGTTTDFEIHLSQMMSNHRRWKYDVVKEVEAMKPVKLLVFFGDEEHEFPVKILSRAGWQVIYLHGGHHYEENKDDIGKMVLEKLGIE